MKAVNKNPNIQVKANNSSLILEEKKPPQKV